MATAKKLEENLRDTFLQCKVCLDNFKQPKTLPCLHTFCADCIAYYIDHNRIGHRKFSCPICRKLIYIPQNGVDDFPDSFFVHNLTDMVQQSSVTPASEDNTESCGICKFKEEITPPIMVCIDCKINLCDNCSETHKSAKITENHTMLPYEQGTSNRENFCRVHRGETIKFYCETCNTCICLPCTFLDHKDHEIEDIKAVRENFSQDMSSLVQQSRDNIIQLTEAKGDMHELENELFGRKEIVKSYIRRSAQDLIRSIQEQEQNLTGEVDAFYDTPSVRRDIQKLERTIFRLDSAHHFAEQLLAPQTSPVAQIVNRGEAKNNLTQALSYELPDMMHHVSKLSQYAHFLPGMGTVRLGSLLHCKGDHSSEAQSICRPMVPSVKATFMDKIKLNTESTRNILSLAFLPSGDLVVLLETENCRVKVYNRKGRIVREFGDASDLPKPSDMVVTKDGLIAITDLHLKHIKIFDQFGNFQKTLGGEGSNALFEVPISLSVDHIGRFIVCDQTRQTLNVLSSEGELSSAHKITDDILPQYICSHNNKIYICDCEHNLILIYSHSRDELDFLCKLSTPDRDTGHFLACSGMCVNTQGDLLITDDVQDKVYILNDKGEVGLVKISGHQILKLSCLALSSDGVLALADQGVSLEPNSSKLQIAMYRVLRDDI